MYCKLFYLRVSKQECWFDSLDLECALPHWLAVVACPTVGMLVLQGHSLGSLELTVHCLAHLHKTIILPCLQWHSKHASAVVSLQARLSNADGIPA
jgi:hypothetical protein